MTSRSAKMGGIGQSSLQTGIIFFERLRACSTSRFTHSEAVGRGGDHDDESIGVCNALLDRRPEFLIRPDGADIIEHFVKAGGAKERLHLRDETVVGRAMGNEGFAHGDGGLFNGGRRSRSGRSHLKRPAAAFKVTREGCSRSPPVVVIA